MPLDLDRLQQRIVGVLLEKELAVPDAYPLTLNALVAGCNQSSNREPRMSIEPFEAEGALRALMDEGWVQQVERAGGRAVRFAHLAREQLGVAEADLALLSLLLNRGPQTVGELRSRAARLHPFASTAAVEARLEALAARPVPYVERLPRQRREHARRWAHRLGRRADAPAPPAEPSPPAPPAPSPPAPPAPAPSAPARDLDLEARVERLERSLGDLAERLDRLEER